MKIAIVTLVVWLWSSAVHADTCDVTVPGASSRAAHIVAEHPRVVHFCEPCGDRAPGAPQTPDGAVPILDLASTYVQTSPVRYDNLALLIGCAVAGVSPSLRVTSETADGALIESDSSPARSESALPIAAPSPPPPVAPAIFMVTSITTGVGWAAIAIGCGATSALWALGMIAVTGRRRRMEPRASELVLPSGHDRADADRA